MPAAMEATATMKAAAAMPTTAIAVTPTAATAEANNGRAIITAIVGRSVIAGAAIVGVIVAVAVGIITATIIATVIARSADTDANDHARIGRRRSNRGRGACQHQCTE